ncbi:MAG: type II CAAX endopeptidase family protein [Bacillota bacterium]|nr:type II CAAX endopeptidase family protein [Bacillota bacterium]
MNERQKALSILSLGVSLMYGLHWLSSFFLAALLPIPLELVKLISLVLLYGVGYALFLAISAQRRSSRLSPVRQSGRLSGRELFLCITLQFMALAIFLILNIVKTSLSGLLGEQLPAEASLSMTPLDIISLFLLAPVMEELVFRRAFAEALLPYGERFYLFSSAFCFAILHAVSFARRGAPLDGLPQLVYTFLLGLIWAYVIVKTRNLRLSILLHIFSNVCGMLLPLLAGIAEPLAPIYLLLVAALGLLGVLMLRNELRDGRVTLDQSARLLHQETFRDLFGSIGVWIQIALVIITIIYRAGGAQA